MSSLLAQIADVESEIARTQKNKATEGHLGRLKAKLAKLKSDVIAANTKSGGKAGEGFDVTKSGDTRVGLVGFPSVGKSTLLTKLTGTESAVAAYEFTTLTAVPGTLNYKGARIQVVDLPGIIEGAKDGKGRGRQVIGTARTCDMILVVLDASKPMTHKRIIEKELEGFGIRLNKRPPNIVFTRKEKGGVAYRAMVPNSKLDDDTAKAICAEYRIHNAEIANRDPNATADDLIDVIENFQRAGRVVYMPCLYVLNKIDSITIEELDLLDKVPHYAMISANHGWGFDDLLEKMWQYLDMVRVYTKPKGQVPDYTEPVILHKDKRSVEELCNRIHRTIIKSLKYAWVWGASVRHQPQRVGREHLLEDEDVIQLVISR